MTVTPWTTAGDCRTPDCRVGTVEDWQRYGTDPVELLSGWEREQLERLLNALCPII
ncbi:DUF7693 family protein [Pseudomonas sp. YL-218 TE3947]|uniref:DUF7693 family protein n=1 Tax=Pseudomonas TaxID=286 RepID=UPI003D1A06C0